MYCDNIDGFAKLLNVKNTPRVRLTAIVVAKRYSVKLFPLEGGAIASNGNCKPGTTIDSAITSPYFQDFYLQSHNGLKGTA
jgi:eukaryotic translation initiation factor 2C